MNMSSTTDNAEKYAKTCISNTNQDGRDKKQKLFEKLLPQNANNDLRSPYQSSIGFFWFNLIAANQINFSEIDLIASIGFKFIILLS